MSKLPCVFVDFNPMIAGRQFWISVHSYLTTVIFVFSWHLLLAIFVFVVNWYDLIVKVSS